MFDLSSLVDSVVEFVGKLLDSGAADTAEAAASAADAADVIAGAAEAADAADAVGAMADATDAMGAATAAAVSGDPGVDATGMEEGGDVADGGVDDAGVDGGPFVDPSMAGLGDAGTPVISGDAEVDDMLNNGVPSARSGDASKISFGSAVSCNVCGCKCFVPASGDITYSLCVCGHPKYKHVWV